MARYTETTPAESDIHNDGYSASYCPQDDKLRLYTGRVERQTYEALVAAGYKATPKQSCSFVATWSIKAEDMAFLLIPEDADIEDEDISPEERAADRAERFAGYRDKRRAEAGGYADRFEAGPDAHGYQNAARAERAAARHDRQRDKALCQWSKAEYWQTRTAGVIAHALHRSDAATRRGRILEIEKEIRRIENEYTPCPKTKPILQERWNDPNGKRVPHVWIRCGSRGGHWQAADRLEGIKASYARYLEHLNMRLIYENGMLANEGGKAADVEMIPGGFIGSRQIWKVNKSAVTGRVVSVAFSASGAPRNIERLGAEAYRAPTAEELAAFQAKQADAKAKAKAEGTAAPALINLTPEGAQQLADIMNAKKTERERVQVVSMTQAEYSARSKGEYGHCKTEDITERGLRYYQNYNGIEWNGSRRIFRVRMISHGYTVGIVVLTDKPQKALPVELITEAGPNPPGRRAAVETLPALAEARRGKSWFRDMGDEVCRLWIVAASWGLTSYASESQFQITEHGEAEMARLAAQAAPAPTAELAPVGCLF